MPAEFENCVAKKGRVRTISGPSKLFGLKSGEYVHICTLKGHVYRGEKRTKKEAGK